MTVGLAADLYERMDQGSLDVIFAKRRAGDERGRSVWREDMIWVAAKNWRRDPDRPLPIVVYPPRSITREAVLIALEAADIPWRIACTCGSLSGLVGAVAGGLGVGAQSACLKADGVVALGPEAGLPALGATEFVVVPAVRRPSAPIEALAGTIFRRRQSAPLRIPWRSPDLAAHSPVAESRSALNSRVVFSAFSRSSRARPLSIACQRQAPRA